MDSWGVLTFGSLQDLSDYIETDINKSKHKIEVYNERLGLLLRRDPKKDSKRIKLSDSGKKWLTYGSLRLYGGQSQKGEAEILFESVDDMNSKIQKLEGTKKGITNLSKVGLGETPIYIVQFKNNIPNKIVVSKQSSTDRPRLKFESELIISAKA